ncbi:hypothetical protein M5689_001565 [Euphorbia peplus]|nr:hypothetical protein M5689_001565 [Euphorbia peplus]
MAKHYFGFSLYFEAATPLDTTFLLADDCTYNVMIHGFLWRKNLVKVAELVCDMPHKGFSADNTTLLLVAENKAIAKLLSTLSNHIKVLFCHCEITINSLQAYQGPVLVSIRKDVAVNPVASRKLLLFVSVEIELSNVLG